MTAPEKTEKRTRASGADSIVSGLMNLRTMSDVVNKLTAADAEAAEILRCKLGQELQKRTEAEARLFRADELKGLPAGRPMVD